MGDDTQKFRDREDDGQKGYKGYGVIHRDYGSNLVDWYSCLREQDSRDPEHCGSLDESLGEFGEVVSTIRRAWRLLADLSVAGRRIDAPRPVGCRNASTACADSAHRRFGWATIRNGGRAVTVWPVGRAGRCRTR